MISYPFVDELTYQARLDQLRETKLAQTQEKQQVIGAMDHDDWALILPPPQMRKIVQAISGSGVMITDCLIEGRATILTAVFTAPNCAASTSGVCSTPTQPMWIRSVRWPAR